MIRSISERKVICALCFFSSSLGSHGSLAKCARKVHCLNEDEDEDEEDKADDEAYFVPAKRFFNFAGSFKRYQLM